MSSCCFDWQFCLLMLACCVRRQDSDGLEKPYKVIWLPGQPKETTTNTRLFLTRNEASTAKGRRCLSSMHGDGVCYRRGAATHQGNLGFCPFERDSEDRETLAKRKMKRRPAKG
jgi:hypothetical protein